MVYAFALLKLVCYTTLLPRALRDDTKNGCVADYTKMPQKNARVLHKSLAYNNLVPRVLDR